MANSILEPEEGGEGEEPEEEKPGPEQPRPAEETLARLSRTIGENLAAGGAERGDVLEWAIGVGLEAAIAESAPGEMERK